MGPSIQRRYLEKTLNWDASDKKEDCDDSDYDPKKVAYMLEYTIDKVGSQSKECPIFKNNIKMRYPKCDFYDEDEIKPCRTAYVQETQKYVDIISNPIQNISKINLNSFVNAYLMEMLMRDPDFLFSSQYFYVNPDTQILNTGPYWDYDKPHWKAAYNTWNIIDFWSFFYQKAVTPLWKSLGRNQPFIEQVSKSKNITVSNLETVKRVISKRREQINNKYFEREIQRWKSFGRSVSIAYTFLLGHGAQTKDTMEKELTVLEQYFIKRANWMLKNQETFDGFVVERSPAIWLALLFFGPLWLSIVVMIVAISFDSCCYNKCMNSRRLTLELNSFVKNNNKKKYIQF